MMNMNTRIVLLCVILFGVVLSASAQTNSSATQVITFSVKITPKITAALDTPSPGNAGLATNSKTVSVDIGYTTLDAPKATELIAEIRAGKVGDDRKADVQNLLQQSERTFSSVDRMLVFTVSE
jgi:hypothetical protein